MIKLSVVIPAYNEEKNINANVLQEVWEYLKMQKYSWEVLLVDDGSKDNTYKLIEDFAKSHKGFTAFKEPYKDTQCGFKAFRYEVASEIFKRMKVFSDNARIEGAAVTAGFDLEVLYIARKLNLKVAEVSVLWHEKGLRREVSPIKDSWMGLRDLLHVRINALEGKYNV